MNKQLRIYSGNVSCSAGYYDNAMNTILMPIISDIFSNDNISDPDIILLNEFYKYDDYSEFYRDFINRDYIVTIDDSYKDGNDVFIAISKKSKLKIIDVNHSKKNENRKGPDYNLVVVEDHDDTKIAIIGIRIRPSKTGNYKENAQEFSKLLELIKNLQNNEISKFIIAGDFNHARLMAERDKYLIPSEIESAYENLNQLPYNYHIIKNKINESGLDLFTPKGFSYPINKGTPYIPNDHLIVSKNWKVEVLEYKEDTTFSDHKALIASISDNRK